MKMRVAITTTATVAISALLSLFGCAFYDAVGLRELSLEGVAVGTVACAVPMLCMHFKL
jgi:hypothetical protein